MAVGSKKVLVVDDFSTMRRMIKNMLKEVGIKDVLEAQDGSAAFEVLQNNDVDLVVSDWNMPVMTGIEFLTKVRESEEFNDLPFVMVTAEGQKEQVIEAVKKGVSGYIIKPFSAEVLKEKIAELFPDEDFE